MCGLLHQQPRGLNGYLLVSSGAVGMGMHQLALRERPASLGLRQACAAVGQGHLMQLYTQAFAQLHVRVAQVLLTQEDLADRDRALCLRTTLMRLLELEAVPVLNENDSVSVRELIEQRRAEQNPQAPNDETGFGDNDGLSARVALALDADALLLLTDVDGVFSANPREDPAAVRIPELREPDQPVHTLGSSSGGTGGMQSKLQAAKLAADGGIITVITSGSQPRVLSRTLAGEDLGTIVWPASRRGARLRHIAVAPKHGALVLNTGALAALTTRKASLLPVGVVAVDGDFARGDVVELRDVSGRVHGRGLVNYDAAGCRALKGHHSNDIARILGYRGYDTLIGRDNLVLGDV